MSIIKLHQRLIELSHALENCDDDDERERIEDEIYEIECELKDEDDEHYNGRHDFR
jgi:hypothetical protein